MAAKGPKKYTKEEMDLVKEGYDAYEEKLTEAFGELALDAQEGKVTEAKVAWDKQIEQTQAKAPSKTRNDILGWNKVKPSAEELENKEKRDLARNYSHSHPALAKRFEELSTKLGDEFKANGMMPVGGWHLTADLNDAYKANLLAAKQHLDKQMPAIRGVRAVLRDTVLEPEVGAAKKPALK